MSRKVLIIEDHPASMKLMRELITKAKLKPICATNLIEAKHIFSSSEPEEFLCAVVDYELPDAPKGQAIDFTLSSFLPTVVVTRYLDDERRDAILKKEVVDYITKENTQVYEYLSRLLSRLEKNKKVGVLVVDAIRARRAAMVSLLRRHNFITFEAPDAEQALNIMQRFSIIKLILVDDDGLPKMNAIELLSELRQNFKKEDLAVIGLSNSKNSALSARYIKSGANDYLLKPYHHEEFFCRIMQNVEYMENIELIRRAADSDFLTGLPNRRYFFEKVQASQSHKPVLQSLAIIDVDHFKQINDSYGHDCGDYTLKEIAKLVAEHFADYTAARFGGEEFCVYFCNVEAADVHKVLEDFRISLATQNYQFEQHSFNCSVSIGLTHQTKGDISSMIRMADELLYKAKNNGRNQVVSN
ncbi:GGDEF domain-containing response regulator [Paraglaciecola hydrolytica]|uniref:diguanylate cyclase n=1 Tax=Paraglaciecola hydrolytica TaxID=1799789 RepID=A0A136A355_9ALTE|nr:diguanylate cyclase [Paraglaciecola hydrolytica]KXI29560.1 diguanylate cyclase response regulator [Paraglaciecola hydrolytica]